MYNAICIFYLGKPEKLIKKVQVHRKRYTEPLATYQLGRRNISKVIKGQNVHFRFN